jgi:hypothetical protein
MEHNLELELELLKPNQVLTNEIVVVENVKLKPDWKKDKGNIALLIFLYMLQGIPLGLTLAMPFLLGARKVSLSDQVSFFKLKI